MNCAFPECSLPAHPGIVVTHEESGLTQHFCGQVHVAQAMLIEAGIADQWVLDEVQQRVQERKNAALRRGAGSEGAPVNRGTVSA